MHDEAIQTRDRKAARLMRVACATLLVSWLGGLVLDWLAPTRWRSPMGESAAQLASGAIDLVSMAVLLWPVLRLARVWRSRLLLGVLAIWGLLTALAIELAVGNIIQLQTGKGPVGIWRLIEGHDSVHNAGMLYLASMEFLGVVAMLFMIPFAIALLRERTLRWSGRLVLAMALLNAVQTLAMAANDALFWWSRAGHAHARVETLVAALTTIASWLTVPGWIALLGVVLVGLVRAPALLRGPRHDNVCPRCGYELAGQRQSGCPECGWGREAARPEPARV